MCTNYDELKDEHRRTVTKGTRLYGAGVCGTLKDPNCEVCSNTREHYVRRDRVRQVKFIFACCILHNLADEDELD